MWVTWEWEHLGKLLSVKVCWPQLPGRVDPGCVGVTGSLSLSLSLWTGLQIPAKPSREELEEITRGKRMFGLLRLFYSHRKYHKHVRLTKQHHDDDLKAVNLKNWYWMLNTSLVMLSYALIRLTASDRCSWCHVYWLGVNIYRKERLSMHELCDCDPRRWW